MKYLSLIGILKVNDWQKPWNSIFIPPKEKVRIFPDLLLKWGNIDDVIYLDLIQIVLLFLFKKLNWAIDTLLKHDQGLSPVNAVDFLDAVQN